VQIARSDVVRVLDQIIASGTPYRANRALAALKKLMSWALDRGMIEVNPIAGLKPPHRERAREVVLSDGELLSLMQASDAEGYPFGDVMKFLILTGQRRGEVAEMRWSEVDLEHGVWTIPAARSKNGQSHEVPLSVPAVSLLRSLPRFWHRIGCSRPPAEVPFPALDVPSVAYLSECPTGEYTTYDARWLPEWPRSAWIPTLSRRCSTTKPGSYRVWLRYITAMATRRKSDRRSANGPSTSLQFPLMRAAAERRPTSAFPPGRDPWRDLYTPDVIRSIGAKLGLKGARDLDLLGLSICETVESFLVIGNEADVAITNRDRVGWIEKQLLRPARTLIAALDESNSGYLAEWPGGELEWIDELLVPPPMGWDKFWHTEGRKLADKGPRVPLTHRKLWLAELKKLVDWAEKKKAEFLKPEKGQRRPQTKFRFQLVYELMLLHKIFFHIANEFELPTIFSVRNHPPLNAEIAIA
jgi:Phage integrase family